jgi:hypothetical protein
MEEKEYSLEFVNKGKPFKMPSWTVKKHNEVLVELAKLEEPILNDTKLTDEEKKKKRAEIDQQNQFILILKSLREVDESVTKEDLESLHPNDLIALFNAVYLAGSKGIYSANFRKKTDTKEKK